MLRRSPDRRRDERGYVAAVMAIIVSTFMFGMAGLGVDVARWWLEAQDVQAAADAAALGSVSYVPIDPAGAKTSVNNITSRNGYVDGVNGTSVTLKAGFKASQIQVTVCGRVQNTFGAILGIKTTTICRTAVADYSGPQPMGSPCNTLGNEPAGSSGAGPTASQLSNPTPKYATCQQVPQFWMHVAGPDVPKENGDQYDTRSCGSSTSSGCNGTVNTDFHPEGYFILVRVGASGVNKNITLQLYDPEFASTDDRCSSAPSDAVTDNNWNSWVSDAIARYHMTTGAESPNAFCTGDMLNNPGAGATTTSFGLRAPNETQDPLKGVPVTGCTKQWPGYTSVTGAELKNANSPLTQSFHLWRTLCTFKPTAAGDYYLQVRTNVAMDGAVNSNDGSYKTAATAAATAASDLYKQTGDDTSVNGGGANRFAVRAYTTAGATPAGAVSIAALGRMPIYMNSDASTATFNLIRVLEGARNKSMQFSFFDLGDAQSAGSVTVLPPADSNMDASDMNGCVATGYVNSTLTGCTLSGLSSGSGWNGKSETISVPIPNDYSCQSSDAGGGGCWFRVRVTFPSGQVTDTTTWTANITGDPVRLIQ